MENKNKVEETKMDLITTIALKRGFFWPSAEIYGGKAGLFSYGHLGKTLKNNFEASWRKFFIKDNENCYEIEYSSILPEQVFVASGHLENFNDPLIECKKCHFRFRADQFIEDNLKINAGEKSIEDMNDLIVKNKLKCPNCKANDFDSVKWFNMMFPIQIGATGKDMAYLAPETAQGAFLAFKREFEATRKKLPLGIGIIGKAFRNEISPRQMFFRLREFSQAELQMFFDSDEINNLDEKIWKEISKEELQVLPQDQKDSKKTFIAIKIDELNKKYKIPKFYLLQMSKMQKFYLEILKFPKDKFRFRELNDKERAFYNKIHWDIEAYFDFFNEFKELGGIHYRTDHDLAGHQKQSKENLEVFYNEKKFTPHVIELSLGIDRNILAFLDIFFKEEKQNERTTFSFPDVLSPIFVSVFPLVNKEGMPEKAEEIYNMLKEKTTAFYDDSASIGKRYRRADEIGVKYCITVDGDSLKDKTVTIRDRDSMKQRRVKISELVKELNL